jgi:hypothetical protein
MTSFAERLPERIRRPLYDAEEWPHDPLNMAIMLACFYVVPPFTGVVWIALLLTGWDQRIPVWLDFSLLIFFVVIGWIALDEWRSRRHSADGEGHGWIWQMVQQYGPRRLANRLMVAATLFKIVAARIVSYLDRFTANDLRASRALFVAEAVILTAIVAWAIAVTIAWRQSHKSGRVPFLFRIWFTAVLCIGLAATIFTIAPTSDGVTSRAIALFLVFFLVSFLGRAIEWIVNRIRARARVPDEGGWPKVVRPAWW